MKNKHNVIFLTTSLLISTLAHSQVLNHRSYLPPLNCHQHIGGPLSAYDTTANTLGIYVVDEHENPVSKAEISVSWNSNPKKIIKKGRTNGRGFFHSHWLPIVDSLKVSILSEHFAPYQFMFPLEGLGYSNIVFVKLCDGG